MSDHTILLQNSELKATFQRINILENVEIYGHISIDEIYAQIIKTHPSLSLATVYKNIILMVKKGLLIEVPIVGQKSKYELKKANHIHLICTNCTKVEDRPHTKEIDNAFKQMSQRNHFELTKQQINLYGVCSECAKYLKLL